MLRIPFELAFECFESLSSGSYLDSNASNPFQIFRICIRMLPIPSVESRSKGSNLILFEWLQFAYEWLESLFNGYNMHLNASNLVQRVRITIRML